MDIANIRSTSRVRTLTGKEIELDIEPDDKVSATSSTQSPALWEAPASHTTRQHTNEYRRALFWDTRANFEELGLPHKGAR